MAKSGGKIRLIRFGQQGVRGAGKNPRTAAQELGEDRLKLDTEKTSLEVR